jgi:hypothetical protein
VLVAAEGRGIGVVTWADQSAVPGDNIRRRPLDRDVLPGGKSACGRPGERKSGLSGRPEITPRFTDRGGKWCSSSLDRLNGVGC